MCHDKYFDVLVKEEITRKKNIPADFGVLNQIET